MTVVRVPGYTSEIKRQVRLSAPVLGTVVLPWWPDEIATSNLASVYETQERPGRAPLLLRSGDSLPEVRIGCIVETSISPTQRNVNQVLIALRKMARARKPVTLRIASRSDRYRITDLGITELEWDNQGRPVSAEVSITLVVASNAAVPVGPIRRKPRK
jgi:hypothetical protein